MAEGRTKLENRQKKRDTEKKNRVGVNLTRREEAIVYCLWRTGRLSYLKSRHGRERKKGVGAKYGGSGIKSHRVRTADFSSIIANKEQDHILEKRRGGCGGRRKE